MPGPPKTSSPAGTPRRLRLRRLAVGLARLGLLLLAAAALHRIHARRAGPASTALESGQVLESVQGFLPTARSLGETPSDDPLVPVLDAGGETVGFAAQTYPEALGITGYAGPSNLLVVLGPDRRVLGTRLITSADTAGHVARVESDERFLSQWNGRPAARLGAADPPVVVTGASLTSEAVARGLAARFGAADAGEWFPGELTLEQVRVFFPGAGDFEEIRPGEYRIDDHRVLLRASRMGVAVRGFQGPSDVLVALEDGVIRSVSMPGSRDNEPYTLDVRDELRFASPYVGTPATAWTGEPPADASLVVSGASYTAGSVDATLREMLRRHLNPASPPNPPPTTWLALAWIAAGSGIGLSPLRARHRVRLGFAIVSVLLGGLGLGLMVGQDQWLGWSETGDLRAAPLTLLVLSGIALMVPVATGRNVYCAHLCPHGAVQTLAGRIGRKRHALPKPVHRRLRFLPWLLLVGLWLLAFLGSGFSPALAEPFEIWSVGFHALLPAAIFVVGLVSAFFLPQGYCHYGCPTGALLKFLTHAPGRWTRRDTLASTLVGLAWAATPWTT